MGAGLVLLSAKTPPQKPRHGRPMAGFCDQREPIIARLRSSSGGRSGADPREWRTMLSHKFLVGDTVTFIPSIRSKNVAGGIYQVIKQLPHNGREFEYHV